MECENIVIHAVPCNEECRIICNVMTFSQCLDNLFLASNDKLVKLVMNNSDFACMCSIVGFIL
jgi:hypothetical protein